MASKRHRRQIGGDVKARVVLEAIKGMRTVSEIAAEHGIHPNQIAKWKKLVMEELPQLFSRRKEESAKADEELKARLFQEIGQLKVELDWVKKKSAELWGG
jgi:transposase-like protein